MWTHSARNADYQRKKVYKWHYGIRITKPELRGLLDESMPASRAGRLIDAVTRDYELVRPKAFVEYKWDRHRGAANASEIHLSPMPTYLATLHEMAHVIVMQRTPCYWASCKRFRELSPHGDLFASVSARLFVEYADARKDMIDGLAGLLRVRRIGYGYARTAPDRLNRTVTGLIHRFQRREPSVEPTAPPHWINRWNTQYGG